MAGARRAVIVGVNNYADSENIKPPLKGAELDATEISERLEKFGDFTVLHRLLGADATCEKIRQAIHELFWISDQCDVALFFFAGHGFRDSYGNGYIAPYDMIRDAPLVKGIRIQELKQFFLSAKNKDQALLILDCCHSGVATDPQNRGIDAVEPLTKMLEVQPGEAIESRGKFILASSRADQKSREILSKHRIRRDTDEAHPHGVLSFCLLEAMDGGATRNGENVTLGALFQHVQKEMSKYREECTFWMAGAGPADDTVLVRASKEQDIRKRLEKARTCLEQHGSPFVFLAIKLVKEARQDFPGIITTPEAIAIIQTINGMLDAYAPKVRAWMGANRLELLTSEVAIQFTELEKLVVKLRFEQVSDLNDLQRDWLMSLCRAGVEETTLEVFKEALMARESRPEASGVDRTSAPSRPETARAASSAGVI
jgi:Caspase domain